MEWPAFIETERLVLRPPMDSDAGAIFDTYAQDPEVTRYLAWRPHQSLSDAEDYVKRRIAGWNSGTELTWMLTRRADRRVVGAIAVRPDGFKADIGYVLGRAFWGHGLTPEAGHAILGVARQFEHLHRVWAVCDIANHASARVMEKIGMQREGILRRWIVHPNVSPLPRDVLCYSWIRTD